MEKIQQAIDLIESIDQQFEKLGNDCTLAVTLLRPIAEQQEVDKKSIEELETQLEKIKNAIGV